MRIGELSDRIGIRDEMGAEAQPLVETSSALTRFLAQSDEQSAA